MADAPPGAAAPLILIADDDRMGRMMVRAALEKAGFAVAEAGDGREALATFERLHPEVVILDVVMPGMDGFQACLSLRCLPGGDGTPIMILTSMDDLDSINRAYDAGATDFMTKPINWMVLGHRIRYMLRAKATLDELRASDARLSSAQRIARLGHWERALDGDGMEWSEGVYGIFGIAPESFTPAYSLYLKLVHPQDRERVSRALTEAVAGERPYNLDLRIVQPDGTMRFVHEQGEIILDPAGRPARMAGTIQDITERKQTEEQIRFLAYYDGLTLLPNRILFMERIDQALAAARRHGRMMGVLFLDLDRFKRINDTLGHTVGDRLLQAVGQRLRTCLRSSDIIGRGDPSESSDTVARLGGDEFIMSLTDIARGEDVARVARRILEALEQPLKLDQHEVQVTASIGISLFPNDGTSAEVLLKNADAAMYHAKESGSGLYVFYNESMNAAALQRLTMEGSLRKALERGEFLLHYQPKVDVGTGAIVGVEALVRWRHPQQGLVSPAAFIPLAEETGLIVPLGDWILRQACAQARAWHAAGHRDLHVAVNLSARQFRQPGLPERVAEAARSAGLEPRHLEFEITESVLLGRSDDALHALQQLRELGARIAIDDFGTGYSSLSYLMRYPIDVLKIDQSFLREVHSRPRHAAITSAIIAMARALDLSVVAEGVETSEQRDLLLRQGCRIMQGYLLGRPMPAEDLTRLLDARSAPPAAAAG